MTDGEEVKTVSGRGIEAAASNVDARVENKISALAPEQLAIVRRGAEIIKSGGLVAFPTETVYGLGANALDAEAVRRDVGDKIPLVIDGGETRFGVESTVIDMTGEHAVLLRPGGLAKEDIEAELGEEVFLPQDQTIIKRSPGTRYRHYAPNVPLILAAPDEIPADAENWAWMGVSEPAGNPAKKIKFRDDAEYARELFRAMRTLEKSGVSAIYAEIPEERGIGLALKDRLVRAAGG